MKKLTTEEWFLVGICITLLALIVMMVMYSFGLLNPLFLAGTTAIIGIELILLNYYGYKKEKARNITIDEWSAWYKEQTKNKQNE